MTRFEIIFSMMTPNLKKEIIKEVLKKFCIIRKKDDLLGSTWYRVYHTDGKTPCNNCPYDNMNDCFKYMLQDMMEEER